MYIKSWAFGSQQFIFLLYSQWILATEIHKHYGFEQQESNPANPSKKSFSQNIPLSLQKMV